MGRRRCCCKPQRICNKCFGEVRSGEDYLAKVPPSVKLTASDFGQCTAQGWGDGEHTWTRGGTYVGTKQRLGPCQYGEIRYDRLGLRARHFLAVGRAGYYRPDIPAEQASHCIIYCGIFVRNHGGSRASVYSFLSEPFEGPIEPGQPYDLENWTMGHRTTLEGDPPVEIWRGACGDADGGILMPHAAKPKIVAVFNAPEPEEE